MFDCSLGPTKKYIRLNTPLPKLEFTLLSSLLNELALINIPDLTRKTTYRDALREVKKKKKAF